MFAGVLFDFDGTLVDTTELIAKSFQHVLSPYLKRTIKPEEIYPYLGVTLRDGLMAFKPDKVDIMLPEYRSYSVKNFPKLTRLFPGVHEGLQKLKTAGVKMAVVTSRARQTTLYGMQLFDLEKFFPVVVSMEDVSIHKPQPEPVLKGLELLDLKPTEVVMIGDSPHDINAAKAAGVTSVAAGWSMIPREHLLLAEPHVIVDSMEEFVSFCINKDAPR